MINSRKVFVAVIAIIGAIKLVITIAYIYWLLAGVPGIARER